jgi:hypothetical protein
MKKVAYLFVAFAFVGVVALSSCKSKTAEAPAVDSTVVEQAPAATPDTAVATDTAAVVK